MHQTNIGYNFQKSDNQLIEKLKPLVKQFILTKTESQIRGYISSKIIFEPNGIKQFGNINIQEFEETDLLLLKKLIYDLIGKIINCLKSLNSYKLVNLYHKYISIINNEILKSEGDIKETVNIFLNVFEELFYLSNYIKLAIDPKFEI